MNTIQKKIQNFVCIILYLLYVIPLDYTDNIQAVIHFTSDIHSHLCYEFSVSKLSLLIVFLSKTNIKQDLEKKKLF